MPRTDVIVMGGGSAGYAAARTAADLGARVTLFDPGPLGGLCILRGCMPSKTLIRSGEIAHWARVASQFGVHVGDVTLNMAEVQARTRRLVAGWRDYRVEQLRGTPGVTLIEQAARFVGPQQVQADDERWEAEEIILATGSYPVVPPIPGLREAGFWTSDDALEATEVPKRLAVLGTGVIGLELGQFYARAGSDVTLVCRRGCILKQLDPDVGPALEGALTREGVTILRNAELVRVDKGDYGKRLTIQADGEQSRLDVDALLVATGRRPLIRGLGLEAAGIEVRDGIPVVDDTLRTTNRRVFAVGDVNGKTYVVNQAVIEGEMAARNAVGRRDEKVSYRVVPAAIFTDPQVALVGLMENQAIAEGRRVLTASYPFDDHGKSVAMGSTDGFVKLIADATSGEILGALVVGPEGAELIHEVTAFVHLRGTVRQLLAMPHIHPTLSEIWTYPAEEIAEAIANY